MQLFIRHGPWSGDGKNDYGLTRQLIVVDVNCGIHVSTITGIALLCALP
jgi:hypothetical protein